MGTRVASEVRSPLILATFLESAEENLSPLMFFPIEKFGMVVILSTSRFITNNVKMIKNEFYEGQGSN